MRTSTITQAEILVGTAFLPIGQHFTALADAVEFMFAHDFAESSQHFDAATGWAQINGYRGETDTRDKMQGRVEFNLNHIENYRSAWI